MVQSKLWGILHGLQVAKSRGFRHVRVDSDSAEAINLITEGAAEYIPLIVHQLVHMIHLLVRQFRVCSAESYSTGAQPISAHYYSPKKRRS